MGETLYNRGNIVYARKYTFFCACVLAIISLVGGFLVFPQNVDALAGMALCLPSKALAEAEALAAVGGTSAASAALSVTTFDPVQAATGERQLSAAKTQEALRNPAGPNGSRH